MALLRPPKTPVQPRFQELFRLRLGGESGTSTRSAKYKGGDDLDYFRFTSSMDDDRQAAALLAAWEGMKESTGGWRRVPIRFLASTPEEVFNGKWNEVWGTAGGRQRCTRRCDGVTTVQWTEEVKAMKSDRMMKQIVKGEIACAAKEGDNSCPLGCKPTGVLRFAIPELPSFGMGVMTTHGIYSIEGLKQDLEAFRGQDLRGIPFVLCRKMKDIPWDKGGGEVMMQKKAVVHLEVDPRYAQAQLSGYARQALALASGEPITIALPAAGMRSASPSFKESQEWEWFESAMAEALRDNDRALVEKVVTAASEWAGLLRNDSECRSAREAIASEHDRALDLLSQAPVKPDKAKDIYQKFQGMIDRSAENPGKIRLAIEWIRKPAQWQHIDGSVIEVEVEDEIETLWRTIAQPEPEAIEVAVVIELEPEAEPETESETALY